MSDFSIRPASLNDRSKLASFLNSQLHIHRHLDWKSPLDWLDDQPFLIAEKEGEIQGLYASPPDPPQISWIRLYGYASQNPSKELWQRFNRQAISVLSQDKTSFHLLALALEDWFEELLVLEKFENHQEIVVLEWNNRLPPSIALPDGINIRKMTKDDLLAVTELDFLAFDPLWRNSIESINLAFQQSASAMVAVTEDTHIIGYQISTALPFYGHLARLAVAPNYQKQAVGYNLVFAMLSEFKQLGIWQVTVNTQNINRASLALYDKIGFRKTGEVFRVYEYPESLK